MMINNMDLLALSPLLIVAAASVVVMLAASFYRRHGAVMLLTLVSFALALASLPLAARLAPRQVTPLIAIDGYGLFYLGLIFAASIAVVLLAYGYLHKRGLQSEEFYILLLVAALGSAVLATSSHFASFFLGLEILSVALYTMIAYPRTTEQAIEAGLKYLVLAGVSSAFLLFGMALIYGALGTMEFGAILSRATAAGQGPLLVMGMAMLVIGFGFKLAVVPFHMWTPDVYQGAPAPVVAFVATVSKGAMLALLLRYAMSANIYQYHPVVLAFALISIASMLAGNLMALLQDNVKRILAYSSISHLGYMLVAFLGGGAMAVQAVTYYVVAYFVTTLGAFGVITVLSGASRDADAIEDYRGLFWRRPVLAAIMTAMMLSLAGIPLTAGFVGKFYVLAAGVRAAMWAMVLTLVLGSAIGVYYYLRIVVALYAHLPAEGPRPAWAVPGPHPVAGYLALAVLSVALVWLGVDPAPLIHLIQSTVVNLVR